MTEIKTLTPAKVTLLWRRYGPDIEWTATIDPPPFDGWETIFGWQHESADEHCADPLHKALFKLGEKTNQLSLYASPLLVVDGGSARPAPALGGLDDTAGEIYEDDLDLRFGGACPVQGAGTLDGRFCYYRARGTGWRFSVWPQGVTDTDDYGLPRSDEEWFYGDREAYAFPDGGWLHRDVSIANLREALVAWRKRSASVEHDCEAEGKFDKFGPNAVGRRCRICGEEFLL
jgi:hypothetical protein